MIGLSLDSKLYRVYNTEDDAFVVTIGNYVLMIPTVEQFKDFMTLTSTELVIGSPVDIISGIRSVQELVLSYANAEEEDILPYVVSSSGMTVTYLPEDEMVILVNPNDVEGRVSMVATKAMYLSGYVDKVIVADNGDDDGDGDNVSTINLEDPLHIESAISLLSLVNENNASEVIKLIRNYSSIEEATEASAIATKIGSIDLVPKKSSKLESSKPKGTVVLESTDPMIIKEVPLGGGTKKASQLKVGDKVVRLGNDHEVSAILPKSDTELNVVLYNEKDHVTLVTVSPDEEFELPRKTRIIKPKDLKVGQHLILGNGEVASITDMIGDDVKVVTCKLVKSLQNPYPDLNTSIVFKADDDVEVIKESYLNQIVPLDGTEPIANQVFTDTPLKVIQDRNRMIDEETEKYEDAEDTKEIIDDNAKSNDKLASAIDKLVEVLNRINGDKDDSEDTDNNEDTSIEDEPVDEVKDDATHDEEDDTEGTKREIPVPEDDL